MNADEDLGTSLEVKCKGQGSLQVTGGIYFNLNTMYMLQGGLLLKFFMN